MPRLLTRLILPEPFRLRVVIALAMLPLWGCGQQPASNTASTVKDNEKVLAELKKQNELLEAQAKKQQAESEAKSKKDKRQSLIDRRANQCAKLLDDHYRKLADLKNLYGGNVAYTSRYNQLQQELRTVLVSECLELAGDEDDFLKSVGDTADLWSTKKSFE